MPYTDPFAEWVNNNQTVFKKHTSVHDILDNANSWNSNQKVATAGTAIRPMIGAMTYSSQDLGIK